MSGVFPQRLGGDREHVHRRLERLDDSEVEDHLGHRVLCLCRGFRVGQRHSSRIRSLVQPGRAIARIDLERRPGVEQDLACLVVCRTRRIDERHVDVGMPQSLADA